MFYAISKKIHTENTQTAMGNKREYENRRITKHKGRHRWTHGKMTRRHTENV